MHLLFGMNDSQAGEKSRQLMGAVKHMILVRANLVDNCVAPGLAGPGPGSGQGQTAVCSRVPVDGLCETQQLPPPATRIHPRAAISHPRCRIAA